MSITHLSNATAGHPAPVLPTNRHGARTLAEAAVIAATDVTCLGPGAADALGSLLDGAAQRWAESFDARYTSMLDHYRRNDDHRVYTDDFLIGAAAAAAEIADADCHAELWLARELLAA